MKYKMLIVDDEYIVRLGIKSTIEWDKYDIEIVGEASGGKKGIELARQLHPDVIITDVRMPDLDGLAMLEVLHKEGLDFVSVIYSGYSDFEYARKAMENGVSGYVLKPIENEALIDKVLWAIGKLEERRKQHNILNQFEQGVEPLREQLFYCLLKGERPDGFEEKIKLVELKIIEKGLVIFGSCPNADRSQLAEMCEKILLALQRFEVEQCVLDDKFVVIVNCFDYDEIPKLLSTALSKHCACSPLKFSLGISRPFSGVEQIPQAYTQAKEAAKNNLFKAVNTVSTCDINSQPHKKIIRDAMEIISKRYAEKLSVREVADELDVSESHLMHEFKGRLDKTFNSCLTEYRILIACEKLLEGLARINEVAYAVGYGDVKYFSQVFREYTGMTPSEYINKYR